MKGFVSIHFRCLARTVDFSGTSLYLCVYKQLRKHERTTARWSRAQGGSPSVIPTASIHYKLKHLLIGVSRF